MWLAVAATVISKVNGGRANESFQEDVVACCRNSRFGGRDGGGRAAILEFFTMDIAGSKAAGAVFALNRKTDVGVSGKMGWESGAYEVSVKDADRTRTHTQLISMFDSPR
jgi:hypothetical protein